ncbi:MAG: DUF3570 domain-containing protein [Pseudomonadota bacterium]
MQLSKLSFIASLAIVSMNVSAQDYVNVQILHYSENDSRVSVIAPSIEVNKDFGTDYTLNVDIVTDSVSGASPTYYDATSGASSYSRGTSTNIKKGNVAFEEQRNAGNANLTTRFKNRDELQIGFSSSSEHDFDSLEFSTSYLHYLDDSHNQSILFGGSYQNNEITIQCNQHTACDVSSGASAKMTSSVINAQVGFIQVIDTSSIANIGVFYSNESGFLSSPYHNIIRNTNVVTNELKPDAKAGYGIKLGYQKAFDDRFSSQLSYRFYNDDWDITSHTVDSLLYYEVGSDIILSGGIRYYTQTKANFYGESFSNEKFASSDERVNAFNAITYKMGIDYKINDKLNYNFGANLYEQSTGLKALYFTTGLKYKF